MQEKHNRQPFVINYTLVVQLWQRKFFLIQGKKQWKGRHTRIEILCCSNWKKEWLRRRVIFSRNSCQELWSSAKILGQKRKKIVEKDLQEFMSCKKRVETMFAVVVRVVCPARVGPKRPFLTIVPVSRSRCKLWYALGNNCHCFSLKSLSSSSSNLFWQRVSLLLFQAKNTSKGQLYLLISCLGESSSFPVDLDVRLFFPFDTLSWISFVSWVPVVSLVVYGVLHLTSCQRRHERDFENELLHDFVIQYVVSDDSASQACLLFLLFLSLSHTSVDDALKQDDSSDVTSKMFMS